MADASPMYDLVATAAFGLEKIVLRELKDLGYPAKIMQPGRVHFRGGDRDIYRANLWLRTAERILIKMGSFSANDFGQLFDGVFALPWESLISANGEFPVRGRSRKSQLSSVPACQRMVKKAIVEKLKAAHAVQELPETGALYTVEVALLDDVATLTIDTTGEGLHKRGYRRLVGAAQIKETLAASLIKLSFWKPERPFIDPFCGSGTIAIEAALIGRNIAPGIKRWFTCESWPTFSDKIVEEIRNEAVAKVLPSLPIRIQAYDLDPEALSLARYHAEQAGVEDDIHFQERDFVDLSSKSEYGCMITNPPYGERLFEEPEVRRLYETFPSVLRRLPTWSHYIITSWLDFEQIVGVEADRRRKLYNGRIECTYYQYHGPQPERSNKREPKKPVVAASQEEKNSASPEVNSTEVSPTEVSPTEVSPTEVSLQTTNNAAAENSRPEPAVVSPASTTTPALPVLSTKRPQTVEEVRQARNEKRQVSLDQKRQKIEAERVFGGSLPEYQRQAEEFGNRLRKLARHLRRWPTRRKITCFRIYDRDIPEIPLVVDRYEEMLHITEYERPHERNPGQHADWLDLMMKTASEALEIKPEMVFMKHRLGQRGKTQYMVQDNQGYKATIQEGGLKFVVNMTDYIDTGIFLDHRVTRSLVRDLSAGKNFLNLFAYTGAFSVYAAEKSIGTTTVDLSNTYLEWAEENMQANGFTGDQHAFVQSDAFDFLYSLPDKPIYDLAVVDPPTFSNSKKTNADWAVQNDYGDLLELLAQKMSVGGTVFFSTNYRRFKMDEAELPSYTVYEISKKTVPEDFRNKRIHRCWQLTVNSK